MLALQIDLFRGFFFLFAFLILFLPHLFFIVPALIVLPLPFQNHLPSRSLPLMSNPSPFHLCHRRCQLNWRLCVQLSLSSLFSYLAFSSGYHRWQMYGWKDAPHVVPLRVWCKTICKEIQGLQTVKKTLPMPSEKGGWTVSDTLFVLLLYDIVFFEVVYIFYVANNTLIRFKSSLSFWRRLSFCH